MKKTVLGLLLILLFGLSACSVERSKAVEAGSLIVELSDGVSIVDTKTIAFDKGDTLFDLLADNFTLYCADEAGEPDDTCSYVGPYGTYLVGIGTLTAFDSGEFIAFYIDGVSSMYGIDMTLPENGKTYRFVLESYVAS